MCVGVYVSCVWVFGSEGGRERLFTIHNKIGIRKQQMEVDEHKLCAYMDDIFLLDDLDNIW